jgi:hypothetical protein
MWVAISLVVLSRLTVAAGAVEEVGKSCLGLFLGAASSTDPFTHHFRV